MGSPEDSADIDVYKIQLDSNRWMDVDHAHGEVRVHYDVRIATLNQNLLTTVSIPMRILHEIVRESKVGARSM